MEDYTDNIETSFVQPEKPYRMQAKVAWILMAIVAVIAVIPVLGFASWFIAGPMLLVSFIMMVIVFAKGGTVHGLALMGCQLLVMPIIVIFGPIISSMLGVAGAVTGAGAAIEYSESNSSSSYNTDSKPPQSIPARSRDAPTSPTPILPEDLESLKAKLLAQQHSISTWVRNGDAVETSSGFLKSGDSIDLETRKAIQQQNVWRQEVFTRIAEMTGKTPEEVAAAYARMATAP